MPKTKKDHSTGAIDGQLNLTVNHGLTIEELRAAGKYNGHISSNITSEHFPCERDGEEEIVLHLVSFGRIMTTAELDAILPTFGGNSDMDDMLTTGVLHPDEQHIRPIVFMGASWVSPDGDRWVGCLDGDAKFRDCALSWADPQSQWHPAYRFAVRARK